MSAPAEPIIDMPEVDIDADEPVPDARLVPDVSAMDDEVRVISGDVDDEDDIDEAVEAGPGSALGAAAVVSGVDTAELSGVDIAVVSGDTV